MRISDWSSDVCSSDLAHRDGAGEVAADAPQARHRGGEIHRDRGRRLRAIACGVAHLRVPRGAAQQALGWNAAGGEAEIGRAPCRVRVGPYVLIQVVAALLNKKNTLH